MDSFIRQITLDGFLSFAPGSAPIPLQPLNVIIGPNGSGKSNFIEAFELLLATPTDFAAAIRDGGGPAEWLWKGSMGKTHQPQPARISIETDNKTIANRPFRYKLEFIATAGGVEILDEVLENVLPDRPGLDDVFFYYRYGRGNSVISMITPLDETSRAGTATPVKRHLKTAKVESTKSVFTEYKDPESYPELAWMARKFMGIQTFREWSFGRYGVIRQPQRSDGRGDRLNFDSSNLALVLNRIEHKDGRHFNALLSKFLPRFERMSTLIEGGKVSFFLHECGLRNPIPSTRISDGTVRFISLLATLLAPEPPPLLCVDEPELGLHPDAMPLLADLFVEASSRMQLIVTTHSDSLVSALTEYASAVMVCENQAGTVLKRVDPGTLTTWLETYRLGEIWKVGALGGNP